MNSVYINAAANETFRNYSRRINFKRLRTAFLCSLSLFLVHGLLLLFLDLSGIYRESVSRILMTNDFIFAFIDIVLYTVITGIYRKMTTNDNYRINRKQKILSSVSLIVIFLGPVALYSISETRMTFVTPFGVICLVVSILFFLNRAMVISLNLFSFALNFILVVILQPQERLSPFQILVPVGVFTVSLAASLMLQKERKSTFSMVQESLAFGKYNLKDFGEKHGLTKREIEVVMLLAEGRQYRNIAEVLSVSENTARTHIKHIYEKTGVSARMQLLHLLNQNRNRSS